MHYSVYPKQKKISHMQVTTGNAMSAIGKISPGYRAVGLTKGQFSLLDLVIAIIDQIGESDLTISTWTPGRNDMEQVRSMLGTAKIKNFRLLVDRSFISRQPLYVELLREFPATDIRQTRTHAKFALLSNDDYRLCIRTSMNFNRNPRMEQFDIDDSTEIFQFFNQAVDELFRAIPAGIDVAARDIETAFNNAFIPAANAADVVDFDAWSWDFDADMD